MNIHDMIAAAKADADRVGHAVWHVLAQLATGQTTEAELAAEHPLIAEAVQVADKAMEAKGVPVKAIETMVLEGVREALSAMKDINATGAAP